MEINITQKLNELDTQAFANDEKCYDLSYLYESQNVSQDKKKRIVEELVKEKVDTKSIYNILTEDFNLGNEDLHDEVFTARAYYGTNYSGLEDNIETTDYSELEDFVWDKLQKGCFVEADGLDGLVHRYSPDKVEWGEDAYGIEDYLVESVVTEQPENSNFTKADVRNIAEKFIKLAEEYELYPELWEYSVTEDGKGKIVLYIKGDWKHDHLALDWLFQDFYMKENFKCVSSVANETDSDGSDWYGGTHTYIIKNEPFMTIETLSESVDEPQNGNDLDNTPTNNQIWHNLENEFERRHSISKILKLDELPSDAIQAKSISELKPNEVVYINHGKGWIIGVRVDHRDTTRGYDSAGNGYNFTERPYYHDVVGAGSMYRGYVYIAPPKKYKVSESVDEPQDADDIRSYINNKKKFTNGTVAEFDPQSLMDKVAETGYSLNSIREDSEGNEYYISIHYEEWYGPKGADNPDEMYYVDVIKETPDGNQTRLFTKDGTATEIVKILNDWKASVK